MRIAMIVERWKPFIGGGQIHAEKLSFELGKLGHQVDIYVFKEKNVITTAGKNVKIIPVGKTKKFTLINRILWLSKVEEAIINAHKKKAYDLVHAHANLPGIPASELQKKLGIPSVFTVHGSGFAVANKMYGVFGYVFGQIEKYIQTKIKYSQVISVDHAFCKFKNVNKKISVIPNGVNLEDFALKTKKNSLFTFLFVGRLHPQKGLSYLIEACEGLKLPKEFQVNIVGEGPLLSELQKNASSNIKFLGRLEGKKLVTEFKKAQVFVLPSLYEGQPLTLLEAWAAKLPVIVTNVGDNKYFVKNGINGLIIPSQNVLALRKAMAKAMKEGSSWGDKGYELVKNKYTWENVALKTLKVYQQALH